jgi:uncharacterized membrane protein
MEIRKVMRLPWRLQFLKDHFFAGLLVVLPLAVIVWMITLGLQAFWHVHFLLPESWRPENFLGEHFLASVLNLIIVVVMSALIAFGVSFLGWASKQYLGHQILEWVSDQIQRIPLIRTVYSGLNQLLKAFTMGGGGQQFSRVVYLEYPRKGTWALAFVTGPVAVPPMEGKFLNIYVPTTPNPTSGFHLMVREEEVHETQLKVEEAFKIIISLGIAQPNGHEHSQAVRK